MRGRVHDQSFITDGARGAWPYWGWRLCGLLLVSLATVSSAPAAGAPQHTWRTVAELTEAEQALLDPRTETPRDGQYPYLPAERYPFEPPYTGFDEQPDSYALRRIIVLLLVKPQTRCAA